jgi:D-xylose transport system permease protein
VTTSPGEEATTVAKAQTSKPEPSVRELIVRSIRQNTKQYTMFIALLAIWVTFSFLTEGVFLTSRNLSNLFVQSATTAILGIAMVLVIVTGHIDLSVGSVLGFTGAACAMLMIKLEWGVIPSVAATLLVGLAIGAWHGFWVAFRKVPAFIVTLASMLMFRGLIIGITGGQTQGLEMAPESAANSFMLVGQGYLPTLSPAEEGQIHDTSLYFSLALIAACVIAGMRRRAARVKYGFSVLPLRFEVARLVLASAAIGAFSFIMVIYAGIPWSVILVIALALIFTFVANNTTFGRHLYAIGGNPDAARLSGINVPRKTFMLFLIMGVMTAIAGIVYTARLNAATTSAGQNAELDAIAAAVIGGTSLMGGEGTIAGAVIGALVMASLDNGMSLMNLDITFQYVIKGLILLFAVWVDMAQRKKS